jgi:hypothetical protein
MEMRRKGTRPFSGERLVLWLYWFFSGYGLRASRPLTALIVPLAVFATLFHLYGFVDSARPFASAQTDAVVDRSRAGFPPSGDEVMDALGSTDAWTYCAATATAVASGPEARLTAEGRVLRVLLRILGPILIALAILAVRGRVKR